MKLMRYRFPICHIPNKDSVAANVLSPVDSPRRTIAFVDAIVSSLSASLNTLYQIKPLSDRDNLCANVLNYWKTGWAENPQILTELNILRAVGGELTIQNGLLLKVSRLVIPSELQGDTGETTRCIEM